MKLYGSLQSRIMESSKQPVPEVGMGATITMYTDRHACTIIDVSPFGRRIIVQEDAATRTDTNGMSESQTYSYTPDPKGAVCVFSLRKDGRYVERCGSNGLLVGSRRHYHDFSF
jgi:hypothetical protein